MQKKFIIIPVFMVLAGFLAPASQAQTPFDDVVNLIMSSNTSVAAAAAGAEAELHEFDAGNALPGPEAEFERLWNSKANGENRWSAGVSQSLPWPGALVSKGKLRDAMVKTRGYSNAVARNDLAVEVRTLLIDYVAAKKDHEVSHELARSLTEMHEQYRKAFENGEATIIDVNKVRIEAARAVVADRQTEAQLRAYTDELMGLASACDNAAVDSRQLEEKLSSLEEYPHLELLDLQSYIDAYNASPEALLAEARVSEAMAEEKFAKASRLPGFSVGYVHAFEDNNHFNGFTFGIELPSWNFGSAKKAAVSRQLEARLNRTAETTRALRNLRAEYLKAESLRNEINEFGPAVEGVNNFRLLKRALDGGELNLLSYLQESSYFVQARRDYVQLCREYALSLTQLSRYADK